MTTSEADRLRSARMFHRQTLGPVYDNFSTTLYRYAMRLTLDGEVAVGCVGETFGRILLALRDSNGPTTRLRCRVNCGCPTA
jgi:hypothetical protein